MAQFFKLNYEVLQQPHPLNPEYGWAKPRIRKTLGGDWECSVHGFLHHGDAVIIKGRHQELKHAWVIMADHLVRHEIHPTYAATQQVLTRGRDASQH